MNSKYEKIGEATYSEVLDLAAGGDDQRCVTLCDTQLLPRTNMNHPDADPGPISIPRRTCGEWTFVSS